MSVCLQVFFEDPFWVGLFSITDVGITKVCRVVFGKEPTDAELHAYLHRNFYQLNFIESESVVLHLYDSVNPKRRQRQISKEIHDNIGATKSYDIVKQSLTQSTKKVKRIERRNIKEHHSEYVMQLKREKRREKHRGH